MATTAVISWSVVRLGENDGFDTSEKSNKKKISIKKPHLTKDSSYIYLLVFSLD